MNFKKYIAAILLIILFLQAGGAMAQQAPAESEIPKVIKDCDSLYPEFPTSINSETDLPEIDASKIDLSTPYKGMYGLNFRLAFEKARTSYHAYMECVFENAVKDLLDSAGGDTSGIFSANAPNLPEWMKPESACPGDEQALTQKLVGGKPEALLKPLLDTYNTYVDYLNLLFDLVQGSPPFDEGGGIETFETLAEKNKYFRFLVENEIQDALAALDGSFIGLKEMRQAYVMHVHFQCMLKNLEFYRRALENLRRVISSLPSVIVNASIHK